MISRTRGGRRCWRGRRGYQAPIDSERNVVVTSPLRLWHMFRALELVYRDAYSSQLNDRYAGKRDDFHGKMARWAHDQVVRGGTGDGADDPVPQAAPPTLQPASGGIAGRDLLRRGSKLDECSAAGMRARVRGQARSKQQERRFK